MLPPTIDELRADYGPSPVPAQSRQRAQFLAMRQSLQQFTIETGKGDRRAVVDCGQLVTWPDELEELRAELATAKRVIAGLTRQLDMANFRIEWDAKGEPQEQIARQADTIKRLHAQVDVLRAQNRSLTDKLLGLEGKRPAPGGAFDDPPGVPTCSVNALPAYTSILTGEPLVPRRKAAREEIACL